MAEIDVLRAAIMLQSNPAFSQVLKELEEDAINEFKTSARDDKDARERAYWQQIAVHRIRVQIEMWANEYQKER